MTTTRTGSRRHRSSMLNRLPLASAIYFAISAMAYGQTQETTPAPAAAQQTPAKSTAAPTLDAVTVTAQKREENLQKVPISIQVLGEEKLKQQNVADFDDYAKLIPSLSYGTTGGGVFSGPGFVQVYMRGVASGGDGNHSGSQPSVGMYLDEQPITTIQGALDIHMYDIARVEALAGPQGTLYGASSQAGTVRIITNKPDPSARSSGYAVEANAIDGGGIGHVVEGFLNQPISDHAAIRIVAWQKHDAGYVDNIHGTRTFPTSQITIDNATRTGNRVQDNYNDADTAGLRAALGIELNDNWTITPTIMGQKTKANGSTGYDPSVGDLEVIHFFPERSNDRWNQASLTVQGKIGNFDLTYAFAHLNRHVDSQADYSDYGFWYDTLSGYGEYACSDFDLETYTCNPGAYVDPSQHIDARDGYGKTSHELRIASPKENRLRVVAGAFWQDQQHDITQRYFLDGLSAVQEVPGWPDTIWLTQQVRKDHDEALFGELSYDFTAKLTGTIGGRFFRTKNSLYGFSGYGDWGWASSGVASCIPGSEQFRGAPCVTNDKRVTGHDSVGKVNFTYKIDDKKLVYVTWSQGFRPGGVNRRGNSYIPDFLTNYEFGWKTTWADDRLSFNGAIFQEDWDKFQFSFLGQNGLTEIHNAAQGRIRGIEGEINWAATYNLMISGGFALYDAKLTQNYCGWIIPGTEDPETNCPAGTIDPNGDEVDGPQAVKGDRLPITARFKGDLNARYTFDWGQGEAFWQVTLSHQGSRRTDLRDFEGGLLGDLKAYTLTDFSVGYKKDSWSLDLFLKNAFDTRAQLTRFQECATGTCGYQPYTVVAQPRTFGVRFSQEF